MAEPLRLPFEGDAPVLSSFPSPGTLLLTLNRPASRNAVTGAMIDHLVFALDQASQDSAVRAVVITGNPAGKAFCAGADLNPGVSGFGGESSRAASGPQMPAEASYRDGGGFSSLACLACTKPVIAALNGAAVGCREQQIGGSGGSLEPPGPLS